MNAPIGHYEAEEMALIRQALYLAADTRIIEIAQTLRMTTSAASEFRASCWDLHEAIAALLPDGTVQP